MKNTPNPKNRRVGLTVIGFVTALAIVLAISVISFRSFQRSFDDETLVRHTYDVLNTTSELLSNMKDTETAQRGFAITGERKYLDPLETSIRKRDSLFHTLHTLTQDNPHHQARLAKLQQLLQEQYDFTGRVIETRKTDGITAAAELITSDAGLANMDRIRRLTREINRDEAQLLAGRKETSLNKVNAAKRVLVFGTLSSASILFTVFLVLRREIRRRRRNEEELFVQNEWFTQTLLSLGDGVITTDRDGIVTMINRAAMQTTGMAGEDALGRHISAIIRLTSEITGKPVVNPALAAMEQNRIMFLEGETFLEINSGEKISIDDSGAPIHNSAGEVIGSVLIFRDVSESRKAHKELKIFHAISNDMIGIAGTDGYFKQLNPSFEKTLGYRNNELLSRPFIDFVHPDDVERTLIEIDRLSKGLPAINFMNRYRDSSGSYKWIEWNVAPSGNMMFAIGRDVTERQEAAAEISTLNETLEKRVEERTAEIIEQRQLTDDILNKIPTEIAVYDANRNYLYVNPTAVPDADIRDWIIGKNDFDYCTLLGLDAEAAKKRMDAFETARNSHSAEWTDSLVINGETQYMLRILHYLENTNLFILTGYDITDLKKAEQEQQLYIADLEEMMFMISHKVRLPITQIIGVATLLEEELTKEELATVVSYTRDSIGLLDTFTRELTMFIHDRRKRNGAT